jgi:hypothetical protein
MGDKYLYELYRIQKLEENINTKNIIYRNFEKIMQNIELPIFSNKRQKYGEFICSKSLKILSIYTDIVIFTQNQESKLKILIKLYDYIYIFLSDIFKCMIKFGISIYCSATKMRDELIGMNNNNLKLKQILKYKVIKVIESIKCIFITHTNILIRVSYNIFKTITEYDIFKIFAQYDGALLDEQICNKLNHTFKKYKFDIIIILIQLKKLNMHTILYIMNYFVFKSININKLNLIPSSIPNKYTAII